MKHYCAKTLSDNANPVRVLNEDAIQDDDNYIYRVPTQSKCIDDKLPYIGNVALFGETVKL